MHYPSTGWRRFAYCAGLRFYPGRMVGETGDHALPHAVLQALLSPRPVALYHFQHLPTGSGGEPPRAGLHAALARASAKSECRTHGQDGRATIGESPTHPYGSGHRTHGRERSPQRLPVPPKAWMRRPRPVHTFLMVMASPAVQGDCHVQAVRSGDLLLRVAVRDRVVAPFQSVDGHLDRLDDSGRVRHTKFQRLVGSVERNRLDFGRSYLDALSSPQRTSLASSAHLGDRP